MLYNIALILVAVGFSSVIGAGILPYKKASIIIMLAGGTICVAATVAWLWLY